MQKHALGSYKCFNHSYSGGPREARVSAAVSTSFTLTNNACFSYFHVDAGRPAPVKVQTGTVRTNCMDNLDRTNVVQASLAKWVLNQQLRTLGVLPADRTIDDYETLSRDFRESQ